MEEFRYYLKNRPPAIGTHPKGAVNVVSFDKRTEVHPGIYAWGYVDYTAPLSYEEIINFELEPSLKAKLYRL